MALQLCDQCTRPPTQRSRDPARLARRSPAVRAACSLLSGETLKITPFEVLMCVRCGDTNGQIAARLGLSVSTVKYHLSRLARVACNDVRTAGVSGAGGRLRAPR